MASWSRHVPSQIARIFRQGLALLPWMVRPSAGVSEKQRRPLRLLSAFLLFITVNTLIGMAVMKNANNTLWVIMLGTATILIIGYGVSRTTDHRLATVIAITMPAVPIIAMILFSPNRDDIPNQLPWLALPLLVCSLLLPLRHTVITAICYVLLIVLLIPFINLPIARMAESMAFMFMIIFFVVAVTAARQREQSEIEHQLAERQQAEEKQRTIINSALDGFWVCNLKGEFLEVNDSYCKMTGYTREELLQMSIPDIEAVENHEQTAQHIKKIMEQGSDRFETQHKCKDGKKIDIEISVNYLNIGEGQMFVFVRDITERKRAEEALRESEEKFAVAFYSSPNSMSITTYKDGVFLEVNDSFTRTNGYTREEVIGRSSKELKIWVNPEERDKITHMLKEQGRVSNEEAHLYSKSGEIMICQYSAELINIGGEECLIFVATDITERRRAEQALRESEEKFAVVFYSSPNAITITSLEDDRHLEINESFTRFTGYSREEVIGHSPKELNLWVKPTEKNRMMDALEKEGRAYNHEFSSRHKSGEIRFGLGSSEVIKIGGKPHRIVVITDITERRRAEQALKESEEKFAKAFRSIPDSISIIRTKDGKIIEINDSFTRINGYTREEVIGHRTSEFKMWADEGEHKRVLAKTKKQGGVRSEEVRLLTKAGKVKTCLFSADPIGIGGEECLICVATDITERKKAEERLRFSDAAFHSIHESVIAVDTEETITHWNEMSEQMFGIKASEALGKKFPEVIEVVESYPGEMQDRIKIVVEQGHHEEEELYRTRNREIWVDVHVQEIRGNGKLYGRVILASDITQRRKAEADLKKTLADLEQSSTRLAATNKELEAFSYSVSHDLRSPLRSIDGFSQALLEDYSDKLDENGQDYLKRLRGASQKMGELIDGLLKLSRLTRAEMREEPVDLSALAKEIAVRLQETQPEHRAKFTIGKQLTTRGDTQLLRVLLENLLGNAWKFTGKTPLAKIEFGATRSNGKKTYFVKDNGAGFDMTYIDKLFGAFQRLHDSSEFPGTGIGLATVRRIINRHGGTIRAEGAPGKGATFYFTLD